MEKLGFWQLFLVFSNQTKVPHWRVREIAHKREEFSSSYSSLEWTFQQVYLEVRLQGEQQTFKSDDIEDRTDLVRLEGLAGGSSFNTNTAAVLSNHQNPPLKEKKCQKKAP